MYDNENDDDDNDDDRLCLWPCLLDCVNSCLYTDDDDDDNNDDDDDDKDDDDDAYLSLWPCMLDCANSSLYPASPRQPQGLNLLINKRPHSWQLTKLATNTTGN